MEQKSYWKAITYAPRADYNAFFCNELVYCMARREAARPRGAPARRVDPRDLHRAAAHPQPPDLPGHRVDRPRRHRAALLLLPRARPRARPLRARRRRAHAPALRAGRRRRRGRAGGVRPRGARVHQGAAQARRRVRGPDRRSSRSSATAPAGIGVDHARLRAPDGPDGPQRARLGRRLGPARARALRRVSRDQRRSRSCSRTATSTTAT